MPEFVEMALGPRATKRAFDDAGLPSDTQRREGIFIPEVSMLKFLGSAARQTGDAELGALLGTHLDIAGYGTWGQYVLDGKTLGDCLQRFAQLADCFFSYSGFRIETKGDFAWVRHRYATRSHESYAQVALASAGSVTNIARHYLGSDFLPSVVDLDIPRPRRTGPLEEVLPFSIRFGAEEFGLAFPRELLGAPRTRAASHPNLTVSEVRRRATLHKSNGLEPALREVIRLQVRSGGPNFDAAARALDMHTRKLQREIDRLGFGFRKLSASIRMETAREMLLETDLKAAEVSKALGYSDPFNFSRAFLRHFGRRPSDLRN